jgi:hypothetical protein
MRFAFRIIMSQAILRLRRARAAATRPGRHRRAGRPRLRSEGQWRAYALPARPHGRRRLDGRQRETVLAGPRKAEPPSTEQPPAPPV